MTTMIPVSSQLKSLGVITDSHMCFDIHVGAVVRSCNYHTRALRHVRKYLTTETTQTIACSVISSQINYCNSLLYGTPVAVVEKLQRAQNDVARVIYQQRKCVSARSLKSLHGCLSNGASSRKYSCHHAQGSVDFRSAVHQRTPTTPSDAAVSAVHGCSASLCAVDTH